MHRERDSEWFPPTEFETGPSKKAKASPNKSKKKSTRAPTFLTQHQDEIFQGKKEGLSHPAIAKRICDRNGLSSTAITGKQIDNWLGYWKRKSKKNKLASVSPQNKNLRVNKSDSWYDDAQELANEEDEELVEIPEEEEAAEDEHEIAAKYLRIFTEHDDEKYSVFAEYGINRSFTAKLVADAEVELNVSLPIPPDALLIGAGYHAAEVDPLSMLDEDFYFLAPEGRRFSVQQDKSSEKPSYYPNEDFPEWVIFTFALEPFRKELKVKTDVDFRKNLEKLLNTVKS